MSDTKAPTPAESWNAYLVFTAVMQAAMVVAFVLFILWRDWENVFLTSIVIALTFIPALLRRRYGIEMPPEFQLITVAFVFLSLFLGSAGDFYYRFWWWDAVLHTGSGFLLGIVGFLALFVLNQSDRLPEGIRPIFVCFFGVTFAVFVGVLWEIFEFAIDRVWPKINMQSTETGVVDTMHDLIVDTLGAVVVGVMGWSYARTGRYSFIADGVRSFVQKNPRLFRKSRRSSD